MRRESGKRGCGCSWLTLLAIILAGAAGWGISVFFSNYSIVILPRDKPALQTPAPKVHPAPTPSVVTAPTPAPTATPPPPVPAPTVNLTELESRMQDWPEEVTLTDKTTFPGELVAPAGTNVKLISAGSEVEVEYQGEDAKLPVEQTDLVARVLTHRAEVARENIIQQQIDEWKAQQARLASDAQAKEMARLYGKAPNHDDAYAAIKNHLKEILREPDSLQMGTVSELFPADYNGRKCWAGKVVYRSKDAMGAYQTQSGVAFMEGEIVIGFSQDNP